MQETDRGEWLLEMGSACVEAAQIHPPFGKPHSATEGFRPASSSRNSPWLHLLDY